MASAGIPRFFIEGYESPFPKDQKYEGVFINGLHQGK